MEATLSRKIAKRAGQDPEEFEAYCAMCSPHYYYQGNFTICVIPLVKPDTFAVGVTKRRPIAVKKVNEVKREIGDEDDEVTAETIALARAYKDLAKKI